MRFKSIINETLFEQSDRTLKVFYSSDIFLRRTEKQTQAVEDETPAEAPTEAPAEAPAEAPTESPVEAQESYSIRGDLLTEEIFRTKSTGVLELSEDESRTILTLDDLLAFVSRQTSESGKEIINDLVVEIISVVQETPEGVNDLIFKSDKINFTLDYGFSKEDSIGLQLNKNMGVDEVSLILRQNGVPSSGSFNSNIFKQKITGIFLKELN